MRAGALLRWRLSDCCARLSLSRLLRARASLMMSCTSSDE